MANPATLLAELTERWDHRLSKSGIDYARGLLPNNDHAEAWAEHRLAVGHLAALDQILTAQEARGLDVSFFREGLDRWTAHVFAFPTRWGEKDNSSGGLLGAPDRGLLRALAGQIEQWHAVPDISTTVAQGELARIIEDAFEALAEEDLPPELRLHLFDVLTHARYCVEAYTVVGDFELAAALQKLAVTFNLARNVAVREETASATRWSKLVDQLAGPLVVSVVGGIGSNVGTYLALGGVG